MRNKYYLFALAMLGMLLWPAQRAQAQDYTECPTDQDECLVEYADDEGSPIDNVLVNTIANDEDRPDGRVYVLQRGGVYYINDPIQNSGFHLRIRGQAADEADEGANDFPPMIQRTAPEDGDPPGNMFEANGDLTLTRLWLMGVTNTSAFGAYGPLRMQAEGATYTFDEIVFDRLYWHHLHGEASGINVTVKNSVFRNLVSNTQKWEGLGIRLESGASSVIFENNTFFNIGFTPYQSESAPADYFRFNHNTLVNVGRSFQAGAQWTEAYITNNIFINPFWQGEDETEYDAPGREDPYVGFFSIEALPAEFGIEETRRIVFNNNLFWRDEAFEDYYESASDPAVRPQPMVNDTTMGFVSLYEGMRIENNYCGDASAAGCDEEVSMPDFGNAPTSSEQYQNMIANIDDIRNEAEETTSYFWDPDRQNTELLPVWPRPEDFSYTSETLMSAGTDGLPLGDLNWFPDEKETFLANHDEYIEDIEALAGEEQTTETVAFIEAEDGETVADATVEEVEGEVYFNFVASGAIEWDFELEEAGTYGLNVYTRSNDVERGQRIIVDGTSLLNSSDYGEYFFDALSTEWQSVEIRQADLVANAEGVNTGDALDMDAGTHTLRIEPSWGYQDFERVEIVDAGGNVVQTLSPLDADNQGANEGCTDADFCPRAFRWVQLQGAGDGVTINVDASEEGTYLFRVFYASDAENTGEFAVDGETASTVNIGADTSSVISETVNMSEGTRSITFTSNSGAFGVDAVQVLLLSGEGTSTEHNTLPEGYALEQNYPNPFNPSTTINYATGAPGKVSLDVFDVLGRKVATLVDARKSAGAHSVQFDARGLASGLYFYRLETPVGTQTRKMVLVK